MVTLKAKASWVAPGCFSVRVTRGVASAAERVKASSWGGTSSREAEAVADMV